ncbi:DUF937 domain-containing protein [Yimella sp. cx-573]|nr:DUF937 domain-containing protein [Yimella sp. cx-573]
MDAREDILSQIPMDQLAAQVGADENTTRQAAEQLIPTLLGGLQANASDEQGAASLYDALGEHQGQVGSLEDVDTQDGQKIVSHVFGAQQDEVVSRIGGLEGGAGSDILKKLLPILAPIVLNYLAGKVLGGGAGQAGGQAPAGDASSTGQGTGGLGDILGDLLGGMAGGAGQGSAGGQGGLPGGLGDILGDLLGGGRK